MDLKTCRWMTRLLYVGCLALAIIALPLDNQILRMGLLGAAPNAERCSPKGERFAANPVGGRCCNWECNGHDEAGFLPLGSVSIEYGNAGAFTGV